MLKKLIRIIFIFLICCGSNVASAQYFQIKGTLLDENAAPLQAASVVLRTQSNTAFVMGCLSDSAGFFVLNQVNPGNYSLLITFLGYLPTRIELNIDGKPRTLTIKDISLKPDTKLLEEMRITAEAIPVIIRNDTIFYRVESFKTRPNEALLELLKKLPNVTVGLDGKITAQGKEINQILVNGKKFFGNDPSFATGVFRADDVKTIEIYDESSKKADFTGINDPNKEKTINLVLKEDRVKGWFGEAVAGGGGSQESDKRYQTNANLNRFTPKKQGTILGVLDNTGGGQSGFQKTQTLALNGSQTIREKIDSDASISWNSSQQVTQQVTARQVFLPTGNLNSAEKTNQNQQSQTLFANFGISSSRDTLNTYGFRGALSATKTKGTEASSNNTTNQNNAKLNASNRKNTNLALGSNADLEFNYGKRAKNSRRNFTISAAGGKFNDERESSIYSANTFFGLNNASSMLDTVEQKVSQINSNLRAGAAMSFGEPIGKNSLLQLDYSLSFLKNRAQLSTFDLDGAAEILNDSLSNNYLNSSLQNLIGLQTQFETKYWFINVALNAQNTLLKGSNAVGNNVELARAFWFVLPSVALNRTNTEGTTFNLAYRTNVTPPDLSQLQAVPNRKDPLNIQEGNPNLKPTYGHQLSAEYNFYNSAKFRGLFASLNTDYIVNRVIQTITVDSNFVRRYKPQNMESEIQLSPRISANAQLKKWKSSFDVGISGSFSKGKVLLNDRQNERVKGSINETFIWDFSPTEWFNCRFNMGFTQSVLRYSIDQNLNQLFFDQNYGNSTIITLPKRWNITSNFNINKSQGRADGFNLVLPIWNMSVSKRLLSGDKLEVSLEVNDLLNKNVSISRNSELNYVEDVQSNILSRYFFLKARYTLTVQ
jgi:outer membrane receptor protein involved in Fe transport